MATVLQLRGGTTAENAAFTGASKELSVDTTLSTVRVHDGVTAGGVLIGGQAAEHDIGTGANEIPLNSDLGSASIKDTGTATGEVPTSDDLDMVGATENFTSNNLNHNEFGGVADKVIMANGVRTSPTTSVVFFPQILGISGDLPTISKAGTFAVFETDTGVNIETGISTLTRITLSGTSGGQVARVVLTGVAGLVAGKSYELKGETAASIITVNT